MELVLWNVVVLEKSGEPSQEDLLVILPQLWGRREDTLLLLLRLFPLVQLVTILVDEETESYQGVVRGIM